MLGLTPRCAPQMKNADYFSNYVTEDFTTYINRKRKSTCHGNHIEMQAMAEMYNRPVEVYQYGTGTAAGPGGPCSACVGSPGC